MAQEPLKLQSVDGSHRSDGHSLIFSQVGFALQVRTSRMCTFHIQVTDKASS